MKCPIKQIAISSKNIIDNILSTKGYANKVDKAFDEISNIKDKASIALIKDRPLLKDILSIKEYSNEINEIISNFNIIKSNIYQKSNKIREYLSYLSKDDSYTLTKALNGAISKNELPTNLVGIYTKLRDMIDQNAKELIKVGALKEENAIKDYLKHYFSEAIDNKRAKLDIAYKRLHKRKDLSYDELIAKQMIQDADFVVSNTIKKFSKIRSCGVELIIFKILLYMSILIIIN